MEGYKLSSLNSKTEAEMTAYLNKRIPGKTPAYFKDYYDVRSTDGRLVSVSQKDELHDIYYCFNPPFRMMPTIAKDVLRMIYKL